MAYTVGARQARPMFLLRPEALPPALRAAITHRQLASGQTLYHRGDESVAVFAVERGRLQLFSSTSEGKRVPLYEIRAGECVSEPALYAERYCGDVVAEIPSSVVGIPKPALLAALQKFPPLADEFMERLTRRFNMLRIRLELRNLQSARERILQYLLIAAAPGQNSVVIDRPLKSIADDLGLTHESFYRTLSELAKEGTISRTKESIAVRIPSSDDRSIPRILRSEAFGNEELGV